jgi:hypothetical protein
MKQGLEGRLRELEREYAAELDWKHVVRIRWMTEAEIKRGDLPGLYKLSAKEVESLVPAIVDSIA